MHYYFHICQIGTVHVIKSLTCLIRNTSVSDSNKDALSIRSSRQFILRFYVKVVRFMMSNAIFNNSSVILSQSALLVEKTEVPRENYRPAASHWETLSQCCIRLHLPWAGLELTTLVVIGTNCIHSCKSNYHTITTTTALLTINEWFHKTSLKIPKGQYNQRP